MNECVDARMTPLGRVLVHLHLTFPAMTSRDFTDCFHGERFFNPSNFAQALVCISSLLHSTKLSGGVLMIWAANWKCVLVFGPPGILPLGACALSSSAPPQMAPFVRLHKLALPKRSDKYTHGYKEYCPRKFPCCPVWVYLHCSNRQLQVTEVTSLESGEGHWGEARVGWKTLKEEQVINLPWGLVLPCTDVLPATALVGTWLPSPLST